MRVARTCVLATCVFACIWPGGANAGETSDPSGLTQSFDVTQRRDVLNAAYVTRSVSMPFPALVNRVVIRLPAPAQVQFGRFSQCDLARLQARGPQSCPRRSKLGRGTGSGVHTVEEVGVRLQLFNGQRVGGRRTLFVYAVAEKGPRATYVGRWDKTKGGRLELQLELGLISTGVIEYAHITSFALRFDGGRDRRVLDAPCRRRWSATGYFATGAELTTADLSSC